MGVVIMDPVSLDCFCFWFGFACLRSRALALPVWNRDEALANLLACHFRTEWYNSARHLQTRPLHPQTHPVQLFDVLERICGTAPNRDLGLCDEARKCRARSEFLFTFFSVGLGLCAINRPLDGKVLPVHMIFEADGNVLLARTR
jgi:hypothetical protein